MKRLLLTLALIAVCGSASLTAQQNPDSGLTISNNPDGFEKLRIGSYGEMLFQRMDYSPNRYNGNDGAPKENRAAVSIPRAIIAFDYKFNPSWILSTEIEFEYGGTGVAREIEYEEGGEYETELEKGGEVVLEQFHITKRFSNAFQLRAGHMIVPVGMTNTHHEPINYFGAVRPEGEMTIIPCTWHDTGLAFLGNYKGFHYELMVLNGLDPNGFSSRYWVRKGKQGLFEGDKITSPSLAGRVEYGGVRNLRLGVSAYWGNTAKNTAKTGKLDGYNGEVTILSADAQYKSNNFTIRANFIYGNLSDSYAISKVNYSLPKAGGYPRTPVAQNAINYYAEAGYNILSFFNCKSKLYPFVRYEYYDSMHKAETTNKGSVVRNPRNQCDLWTVGLNYYPLPNLVIKADYAHRRVGGGDFNSENTLSVAFGYVAWFFSK